MVEGGVWKVMEDKGVVYFHVGCIIALFGWSLQNKLRAAAVKTTANISVLIKVGHHGYQDGSPDMFW